MIGKYTDEDFFVKLTTDEQCDYLISITSDMTNAQIKELVYKINNVRSSIIDKQLAELDTSKRLSIEHFF